MFRKPKKSKSKATFRSKKRQISTDSDQDEPSAGSGSGVAEAPTVPKKQKRFRKRDDNSDGDGSSSENEEEAKNQSSLLHQIKNEQQQSSNKSSRLTAQQRRNSTKRVMHHFEAGSKQMTEKELATRGAEFHPTTATGATANTRTTTFADDNKESNKDGGGGGDDADNKLYKGQNVARNKFLAGPLKAPTFVRTTSRFDYQPDICKDYKDTGFCGFGDTCIYLHDRGDTMSGWQLELEWEDKKKKEREKKELEMENFAKGICIPVPGGGNAGDDDDGGPKVDDGIPFACYLCRKFFTDPVVTKCGHYFCESCIIKHTRDNNSTACPICKKDTFGVFNHPTKLVLKKRRSVGSKGTWEDFLNAHQKD